MQPMKAGSRVFQEFILLNRKARCNLINYIFIGLSEVKEKLFSHFFYLVNYLSLGKYFKFCSVCHIILETLFFFSEMILGLH